MLFNWIIYKELNPDLAKAGIKTQQQYIQHFINHGKKENRKYSIFQVYPNFNHGLIRSSNTAFKNMSLENVELHFLRNSQINKSLAKPAAKPEAKPEAKPVVKPLDKPSAKLAYEFNYIRYILYNKLMELGIYDETEAKKHHIENKLNYNFIDNAQLKNKKYIITLLGYTKIKDDGGRHTNWYPWNRFKNVFETIGYKCEWVEFSEVKNSSENRIFITWNEPPANEIYNSNKFNKGDIIIQKLTSLGKGMENVNWTSNAYNWCKGWKWPIYKMVEDLYDKGVNIYAFGCKTIIDDFPEKKRICDKLKDRIFWISWGGTPFNFKQILQAKPVTNNFKMDISFVGSKWGKVGRGNIDAWEKYITPLEKQTKYTFNTSGGIGSKMVSDNDMVKTLQSAKICPILHAPSWQAERGIQDRFYTVFISGRFGICDNLGAIDLFGDKIKDICTTNNKEYFEKSIYYINNIDKQVEYITHIQSLIKNKYNFYVQWYDIMTKIN